MKIVIDTNVIVDALASRAPFNTNAELIILLVAEQKIIAAITASTASDIYYLTRKYLKNSADTTAQMKKLFALVEVIAVDKADCLDAFDTGITDYEDALLAVCAGKWQADLVITRNVKDFTASPVSAITPAEFLERM